MPRSSLLQLHTNERLLSRETAPLHADTAWGKHAYIVHHTVVVDAWYGHAPVRMKEGGYTQLQLPAMNEALLAAALVGVVPVHSPACVTRRDWPFFVRACCCARRLDVWVWSWWRGFVTPVCGEAVGAHSVTVREESGVSQAGRTASAITSCHAQNTVNATSSYVHASRQFACVPGAPLLEAEGQSATATRPSQPHPVAAKGLFLHSTNNTTGVAAC